MRRLVVILLVLVGALASSGGALAFFTAHAKGSARFHVSDPSNDLSLDIAPITDSLSPGESVAVHFTVTNGGGWTVRVGKVTLDSITGLPDGCDDGNFSFAPVALNQRLGPNDKASDTGRLAMKRGADTDCAGADPVLHLEVG